MSRTRRFLVLAEGNFGPLSSKTANACIRYAPQDVAVVLDSATAGRTVQEVLGFGGGIPIVASFDDAMTYTPTALLIGIAPPGGQLPPAWRGLLLRAIRAGLDVWSGLHSLLGDDPEFAAAAAEQEVEIRDLRRAPADLDVACGRARTVEATVVLTVGSDCNIGKMTTQLQIRDAVARHGHRVAFAATGQTGILVEGRGIAVDAVIADFIAGAAERLTVDAAAGADIVLVEGQGSLVHPAFSGVTLGLMHGSMPHAMILCAQPSRTAINRHPWVPLPSLRELIRLYECVAEPLRPSPVIGIALNTFDLSDVEAHEAIERARAETGLPVTDPVRFATSVLADAIDAFHRERLEALAALA